MKDKGKIVDISKIHFVGIKGVGMTALALCALDMGIKVTGSDLKEVFVTDETLKKAGIEWKVGFKKENVGSPDLVITTGAHGGMENPENVYAFKKGIPVMMQGQALNEFSKGKKLVSVCGVGGKTSISSMVATILSVADKKSSYAIGVGEIFPIGKPGKYNAGGEYFVTEADEYVVEPGKDLTPKFLLLNPHITIVTNVEHDHPDVYPTFEDVKKAYMKFMKKTPENGHLIVSGDNKNTLELAKKSGKKFITYGMNSNFDWSIKILKEEGLKTKFELTGKDEKVEINLSVPGSYNVQNATASYIASRLSGVTKKEAVKGIESFVGSKRRFEEMGSTETGALIVDDYAHHPEELKFVISTAKKAFPQKKIITVFQPHTYSRTKSLFDEFTKSFGSADKAIFTDIYSSAREVKDESVSSEKLASRVGGIYTGNLDETTNWLRKNTGPNDLILTLGAGDIFHIHKKLLKK